MGYVFMYASVSLRAGKDVVLTAVKRYGKVLEFASDELRADNEIVLTAINHCGGCSLKYADEKSRTDPKVILASVSQDRAEGKFFHADKTQSYCSIRFADHELLAYRQFVL